MSEAAAQAAYEHNGQPVTREAFYAIACDPQRSVAVEACAGAGKTWMLVSRMLRALLDGCAPHEILAITFTKKAAGEMRQRLQEWLQEFAAKPLPDLEKELIARGIGPQRALDKREQLQKLYRQTLDAGRPVQIRTFHSWFAALLGTAPLSVLEQQGLPAHYDLLEDDAEAVREVWRPYLAAVAQDAALRADYEACVAHHGRSQTHKALEGALADADRHARRHARDPGPAARDGDLEVGAADAGPTFFVRHGEARAVRGPHVEGRVAPHAHIIPRAVQS